MRESVFQENTIAEVKRLFPGCVVLKNDSGYLQGVPDFLILYKNKWAMLEFKKSRDASHRPNQDYYVRLMDEMSFARFIFPENKEEVLNDLKAAFRT